MQLKSVNSDYEFIFLIHSIEGFSNLQPVSK
jgi:hypothetical protein